MKCPYCDKELPKGGIPTGRDSVYWYPEGVNKGWVAEWDEEAVLLAKVGFFDASEAEAYYCAECRMVFVPVPEREESTMDKLKKKWNDISEKMESAAEERKTRQEEEKREKQREKRGRKDPWER